MNQLELAILETLAELFEARSKYHLDAAMSRRDYAEDEKKDCENDEAREVVENEIGFSDGKGMGLQEAAEKLRAMLNVMKAQL
jgi:hypothetical protein